MSVERGEEFLAHHPREADQCTRCAEPWPCVIVKAYEYGVEDGIDAYVAMAAFNAAVNAAFAEELGKEEAQ